LTLARTFVDEWRGLIFEDRRLSSNAKLVAYALSVHLNSAGRSSWTGRNALALGTSRTRRCTQNASRELQRLGYLRVERKSGGANVYEALVPSEDDS
jgi:N-acetylmuramoyl-L-alanine amidase